MQVATRRTRTAGKVEIPNVDDHVSKLEHMGKETVKKLQDIRASAIQSGIDITVPDNRIDKGQTPAPPIHPSLFAVTADSCITILPAPFCGTSGWIRITWAARHHCCRAPAVDAISVHDDVHLLCLHCLLMIACCISA